jgi:hypothetical protein
MTADEREQYEREAAALRKNMDEETFKASWEAGRRLTLKQAIQEAL